MTNIRFHFQTRLVGYVGTLPRSPQGALFHRFLPDGKTDAVNLTLDSDPHEIRVWFERRSKSSSGVLEWDTQGTEFDQAIMRRQARLDGGYLFGEMQMSDVSDTELVALRHNPKAAGDTFGQDSAEDPAYIALARRLLDVLVPRLAAFVSTLRSQYGQFWLQEPRPWDSRRATLGTYCSSDLGLRWWDDGKQCWYRFLPTNSGASVAIQPLPGRGFEEYLTEADWRRLQSTRCFDNISTELQLLGNAARSLDSGDYRQAFVEVISALELAISNRLSSQNKSIKSAIQSFRDRETRSAHVAVILLVLGAPENETETALRAVKLRNDVVHEGYQPTESDAQMIRGVIQTIRRISGTEEIKTPVLDLSFNKLFPS